MTAPASITWHSFDLKTCRRGQQLIVKAGTGTSFGRIIGEATDVSGLGVLMELDGEPIVGWESATLPGRTMLVAINEIDEPMWAGMVIRRRADRTEWAAVDLVTLEAYMDRRYVTDHVFTATEQGLIVEGILTADLIPTGVHFLIDADAPKLRDRTYLDDDDKTVFAALTELMEVDDGSDFTVDLQWANDEHTLLDPVVRVRDRIGSSSLYPPAFELPGPVVDFSLTEDYTVENGANDVMAVSSGEGDTRPESAHQTDTALIDGGWPKFEHRFTPSTSIIETETLNAHARAKLAAMRDGVIELAVTSRLDEGPMINADFYLGDDVAVSLTCPRFPEQTGPDGDKVPGLSTVARCIGWDIDYQARTLTPRLWLED